MTSSMVYWCLSGWVSFRSEALSPFSSFTSFNMQVCVVDFSSSSQAFREHFSLKVDTLMLLSCCPQHRQKYAFSDIIEGNICYCTFKWCTKSRSWHLRHPFTKFCGNLFVTFCVTLLTNKQTYKHRWKHNVYIKRAFWHCPLLFYDSRVFVSKRRNVFLWDCFWPSILW